MTLRLTFNFFRLASGAALASMLFLMPQVLMPQASAQGAADGAGAFRGLNGVWSGTGTVKLSSGSNERIRCSIKYIVEDNGSNLQQNMRCASDSYKFDLSSDVIRQGSSFSGTWTETSRGVSGNITGKVRGDELQARAASPTFTALLVVNTRGDKQTVSITSPGSDLSEVSISLSRRSR